MSNMTLSNKPKNAVSKSKSRKLKILEEILAESSSPALNVSINYASAKQSLINHTKLLNLIEELKDIESQTELRLPERNDKTWSNFFRWIDDNLKLHDEGPISDRITIRKDSINSKEYSLIAKKLINENEIIFSMPRKLMLTSELCSQDPKLADFIRNDSIASSMPNITLVLHLLNEYSKGKKSFWWPYLSILPNKILPVLSMNLDTLNKISVSAHIFEFLKMIRAISRQYSYFYKRLQETSLPLNKYFTFQYYLWGVSMVCSRQNDIPPLQESLTQSQVLALIPILDMCNHHCQSSKPFFQSNKSIYSASKVIQPGNEITIDYGIRSTGKFFIYNGFTPEVVPNDSIPQTFVINGNGTVYTSKVKLLGLLNKPIIGTFDLQYYDEMTWFENDKDKLLFLFILCLDEEEVNKIMQSHDPVDKLDKILNFSTTTTEVTSEENIDLDEVKLVRDRVYSRILEYLSKRSSIAIMLLDKLINDKDNTQELEIVKLLKYEKSIYQSYIVKQNSN